jgi:hypothetical protein
MHGQQNDKYKMHGQQNDKYAESTVSKTSKFVSYSYENRPGNTLN